LPRSNSTFSIDSLVRQEFVPIAPPKTYVSKSNRHHQPKRNQFKYDSLPFSRNCGGIRIHTDHSHANKDSCEHQGVDRGGGAIEETTKSTEPTAATTTSSTTTVNSIFDQEKGEETGEDVLAVVEDSALVHSPEQEAASLPTG